MKGISRVAIIGGGPAGIACAIQLKRFGIACIVFEKNIIGGMLHNAHSIENYPGFPEGIKGPALADRLKQQADRFSVPVLKEEIKTADQQNGIFILKGKNNEYLCERLVIASGTDPNEIRGCKINDEARRLIFREVYPLKQLSNKTIGIVGAGDAAFDYALSLAPANQVHIFNRSNRIKALPALAEKIKAAQNIRYHSEVLVNEITTDENGLRILTNKTLHSLDCMLFAIGRKPALEFLGPALRAQLQKLVEEKLLFMIGDVNNREYRQMAIAAGDGLKCAMIINELES